MAEQDITRTEQATPRRKAESRKQGHVAISREIPTAALLVGALAFLAAGGQNITAQLVDLTKQWCRTAIEVGARGPLLPETLGPLLKTLLIQLASLTLPAVLTLTAIGGAAYLLQTGFLWHSEAVSLDLSRVNPLAGLRRLLSTRVVVELLKALVKVTVFVGAFVLAVHEELDELPALVQADLTSAMAMTARLLFKVVGYFALGAVAIAIADYAYQRFEWERSLRMTRQEIKQELREVEGDPLLRARLRSLQREVTRNRMMAAVPKADVVITNPTHLAVALQYDPATMAAPVVVAKGAGFLAERIKELARQHGVMVIEHPPVAQALFKLVEVGREIPTELYRAVAEILALVYRAKGKVLVRGVTSDPTSGPQPGTSS
jgi:flagellar biosynthetic protein FlhB